MHAVNVIDLFRQSATVFRFEDEAERSAGAAVVSAAELAAAGVVNAGHLVAAGFTAGDRLAVRLPNGRSYLEAICACAAARLVLVSVNTRYSDAEAKDLVTRSGAKAVVASDADWAALTADNTRAEHISTYEMSSPEPQADNPFLIFTTSGTTSKPKMVRHTQGSIARHGHDAGRGFGYRQDDRVLLVMPFGGTFGMSNLTAALAAGAPAWVTNGFAAHDVAALIRRQRITVLNGSDDMFHRLVEAGADLSSIRLGGYARFNTSLEGIVQRAAERGAVIAGLYGMSEVQALYSLRNPFASAEIRSLAGGTLVSEDASMRVVDGELQLRGPSLFEGYLAEGGEHIDAALTAAAFQEGWFCTGDAADADDNRTFTYHSRIADVLRLGGFLVAPADIEEAILGVDGIDQAAVVAVDRPTGARPVAFVVSSGAVDEAAVIAHCASKLARYKVPVRVVQLDSFPVTPSANGNKIRVTELRSKAADLLADFVQ